MATYGSIKYSGVLDDEVGDNFITESTVLPGIIFDNTLLAINLHKIGLLQVGVGTKRWYAPFNLEVTKINAKLAGAADDNVVADVKKNGISAQTVTIPTGDVSAVISSPTLLLLEGEYLTVDITGAGVSNGNDLYLQFIYKRT
jgi:hypothetical protein